MPGNLLLFGPDGSLNRYEVGGPSRFSPASGAPESRVAYAAAHVVADPLADADPTTEVALDWDATLRYRHYLWGLGWQTTRALIRRSLAEARGARAEIACGAGTDHLALAPGRTLEEVEEAYKEQCGFVEGEGGRVILMASRDLAAAAKTPDDYQRVYDAVLSQVSRPVIIHWLGEAFDPHLAGYWGHDESRAAMEMCLEVVESHAAKVEGIKLSLLDADLEKEMRQRLPEGVRMYTGDDFNYPELILGDAAGASDALLGVFDPIAPAASAALRALDAGDTEKYGRILAPTVPLARHMFCAPTRFYKTGVVFLAYLNGHQDHFRMVGGLESARSAVHLSELFVLADRSGLLLHPELAAERMSLVLSLAGIEA
jgi:hypothetical protein